MVPVGMRDEYIFYFPAFLQKTRAAAIATVKKDAGLFYEIPGREKCGRVARDLKAMVQISAIISLHTTHPTG
jgi:hypothetical protein